jgi:hypothetical protein
LQWCLPIDGPGELLVFLANLPLLIIAIVLPVIARRSRKPLLTPLASGLLAFFSLIQASVATPSITRRIGPWNELRSRLM